MRSHHPIAHGNRHPRENFTEIREDNGLTTWWSYSTPIAFVGGGFPFTWTETLWGNTTARHIITARQIANHGDGFGPLSWDWFRTALYVARNGGTIEDWLATMKLRWEVAA